MKKISLTLLILIFVAGAGSAQDPSLTWAKRLGGGNQEITYSLAVDAHGSVYSSGYFWDSPDMDPGTGTYFLNASNTTSNIFITKLDSLGQFQWSKGIGGQTPDDNGYAYATAVDTSGNVYTCGYFQGTLDFDPGTDVFEMHSSGGSTFLTKLDTNGNFIWALQVGGGGITLISAMTMNEAGNIYLTGLLDNTADFDPGTGIYDLTGDADIFIVALDMEGHFLWAGSMGGPTIDNSESIVTDPSGNIYLAGSFTDTADFDPGVDTYNLTSNGVYDAFVVKLDIDGDLVWARSWGSQQSDECHSLCVDVVGNIYSTGFFQETVDFDPGGGTYDVSAFFAKDIFVSKLNPVGEFIWARAMGTGNNEGGEAIAVDHGGNVYTAGFFTYDADFDPGPSVYELNAMGLQADAFISKLDIFGHFVWAVRIGGEDTDAVWSMIVDATGNIYTAGTFREVVDFDPGEGEFNMTANAYDDVFIAKYNTDISMDLNDIAIVPEVVQIYPNPGHGEFIVSTTGSRGVLDIYNCSGAKVYSSKVRSGKTKVDMTGAAAGLYYVTVTGEDSVFAKGKFVLE